MRLTLSSLLGKETRRGRREMCVNTWWAFSSARETSQDYRNRYFTWCYIPHMHVSAISHTCMSVLHPTHACRYLPHMHVLIQVCVHIIDSVHTEMVRMKEEWEATCIKTPPTSKANKQPSVESSTSDSSEQESDSYCFELLSMLIGLSQSEVGCGFLSEQNKLIHDLFTLLHVATLRIQLQVRHLSPPLPSPPLPSPPLPSPPLPSPPLPSSPLPSPPLPSPPLPPHTSSVMIMSKSMLA